MQQNIIWTNDTDQIDASGRAAPSGHWCEKSTACPHPRKNTETVEKDKPQPENITIL